MVFCSNCGQPAQGAFCTLCGARIQDSNSNQQPPLSPQTRSWLPWLIVGAVFVGILAVGGVLLLATRGSDQPAAAAATKSADDQPQTMEPTTPAPTVTVTKKAAPKPRVTVTVKPAPPAVPRAPGGAKSCGNNVYAGGTASCPFALNVADAYRSSNGARYLYDVYSPSTGRFYDVTCDGVSPATCRVGRAIIYVY